MARAVGGIDSERDIFDGAGFRIRKAQLLSLQSPSLLQPSHSCSVISRAHPRGSSGRVASHLNLQLIHNKKLND